MGRWSLGGIGWAGFLAALALLAPSRVAASAGAVPCGPEGAGAGPAGEGVGYAQLPIVLRVGLPEDSLLASLPRQELSDRVGEMFGQMYRDFGLCRGQRGLQVNVALGDEYQIVDWLAQGRIDAGVTTDVGLFLLTRFDRQSLVELAEGPQIARQLPPLRQTLRSYDVTATRVEERGSPLEDFQAFLSRLWEDAGAPAATGGLAVRLEAPSHLSTSAFAELLGRANLWLAGKAAAEGRALREDRKERFWDLFLERTSFTFRRDPKPPEPGGEGRVIQAGEEPSATGGYRSHLVLPAQLAAGLLRPGSFRNATYRLPPGSEELLSACAPPPLLPSKERASAVRPREAGGEACRVPAPFQRWLAADPIFRVRSYGFKVGESLALLREHQRTSGTSKLALVLPGGGVKAVYQSQLLDELYGRGLLRNALDPGARGPELGLPVDAVIGTSGGALLGYFVARLAAHGPFNLSQILWQNERGKTLDSADIFDWGDLLRYTSAVAIFFVFAVCLALFSFQAARYARGMEERTYPATRLRLALALWPPLALAPLLVAQVNGAAGQEHIPSSEGLFYLICTTIAIFADQCFVVRPEPSQEPTVPLLHPLVVGLPALALLTLPFVVEAGNPEGWSRQPLLVAGAFGPLLVLVLAAFILPVYRYRSWPKGARRRAVASVAELAAAWFLGLLLFALPLALWRRLLRVPLFLLGFVLLFFLYWFGAAVRRRMGRVSTFRLRGYYAGVAVATLLVALLCAPRDLAEGGCSLWFRESRLELSLGAFLVCLGLLFLLAALLLWVVRAPQYRVEGAREFRAALGLALFLVALVNILLFALQGLGAAVPGLSALQRISFFELTGGFWLWLLGVSFASSVVLIVAGAIVARRHPNHRLIRGLQYLCGSHPNGIFFNRRFVRMVLLGLGALTWWNFVLAPALYGNRLARGFLTSAVQRFEKEAQQAGSGSPSVPTQLRTQFLTPANVLERDGTRYFLVLPPGAEGCQPIFQPPGSGAVWNQFTIRDQGAREEPRGPGCPQAIAWSQEQIQSVIFASGSPFPIFPSHWVDIPREDDPRQTEKVALVDGGYSNNEPVDAAVGIGSAQVLIVRSASLLPVAAPPGRAARKDLLRRFRGPLVGDLSRLAGFLYERSQQQDRLSRREVFTVSLSPRPSDDWPALFDFRTRVVERLRSAAKGDLGRRIGAVESWGPPRYQLSIEVTPDGEAKTTSSGRSAARPRSSRPPSRRG